MVDKAAALVLWFDQINNDDVALVGGKNASLGEMYSQLTDKGVRIPNGFAVTAKGYKFLLAHSGIKEEIAKILEGLDTHNVQDLAERGEKIRNLIRNASFPNELRDAIVEAYRHMCIQYGENADVAVRSSATAEDLPDASFAGQQETYLNIRGGDQLIDACKKCFASLFTNRAISYRVDKGFDHMEVHLSIGVQKMVRSDLSSSGVMFSIDTESGFKDVVFITASYGLGETIVQGAVNPDEYYVFKPTLRDGKRPIISKEVGAKKIKMIYDEGGNKGTTKTIPVPDADRKSFAINDDEILTLAKWAMIVEDHYSEKAGHFKPMDLEWAKDGETNELFIVQARPETVMSQKDYTILEEYELKEKGQIVITGHSVGSKIGQGLANIIKDSKDIHKFQEGQVLVTDMTDPDWEPIMKIASAIVTNRGGRTCFGGDSTILTNRGFFTLKQINETGFEGLLTLSFNKSTKKMEWKPIIASMKKKSKRIRISVSQSGRVNDNELIITPDHKMVNIRNSELVDTEIIDLLNKEEMLCISQKIPNLNINSEKDKKLAYLLGGIITDGHIYRSRTHGEVQFIQKPTIEKKEFINYMQKCMTQIYNKSFVPREKKVSSGMIRGKEVRGQATAYRLYSKQIAYQMHEEEQKIVTTLLQGTEELAYSFLGGVIDGDGSLYNNRIQIYASKDLLLQAVIVACLKIGIVPQVTKNRNIYNIQIVEKLNQILKYTKRVKGDLKERVIKTRFFAARQVLGQEVKGDLKVRRNKNLYISTDGLKQINTPKIQNLLKSDLRMQRVIKLNKEDHGDVYNITVRDTHTYVVFTKKLTPVIVNNCHAAIISRELGIPCVVGTLEGTERIRHDQPITVNCAEGDEGKIYDGLLRFEINKKDLKEFPETKTKVMMNLANPEQAFEASFIPNQGIGLAREEFIINSYIKIHPKALIGYENLKDKEAKKKIDELTYGYEDKTQFFVDKLAYGIARLAAAFYPKDVILRFSDFKTNEYANLIGGKEFEPVEDNPMIGWRGASRYYREGYSDGFALECKAIKKVREDMGLNNLKVMIPFCRTVEEGKKVLAEMEKNGLKRGENDLHVYVMCEIPSNVILADQFAEIFDGFSIGSNDLTQLTLGLDRDSEIVADLYDENNEAVKRLISQVIKVAKEKGKKIGICGQAPSDYPEFAQFLVREGIDSISLNPDTVIKTTLKIKEEEDKL